MAAEIWLFVVGIVFTPTAYKIWRLFLGKPVYLEQILGREFT